MKTILKFRFLLLVLLVGTFTACKKNDQLSGPNYEVLLNKDESFQHYVAYDIVQSSIFRMKTAGSLRNGNQQKFVTELIKTKSEDELPAMFDKYGISLNDFKQYLENRIQNNINIRNSFPEIKALPDDQENIIFENAYKATGEKFLAKLSSKVRSKEDLVKKNQLNNPNKNTLSLLKSFNYTSNSLIATSEAEIFLTPEMDEDQMIDLMSNLIVDYITSADITFGEFYGCLHAAAIGTFGEIKKIFEAAQGASTAAVIQEMVAVGARFILKNIGWIGAALLIFNFSSCLYLVA